MKLTPLHRKVLAYLEPLPADLLDPTIASFTQRTQVKLSQAVTHLLRHSRGTEPMVWDPWILKDGEVYRLFYLKGVEGQNPWWTISNICGAVSTDLEHWEELGTLLEPDPQNDWESGRVCAGCTYKEDDTYYLFYSAGGKEMPHLRNEGIGLAVSKDGLQFSRQSNRPLIMPDPDDLWYGRSNWTNHFHWRDPYVLKDETTGKYYMFICASAKATGQFQGCVGLAVADRITGPYEILPPVVEMTDHWAYYHMERPQVIYRAGKYHLFFSCFKMFFEQTWLQRERHQRITNSSLYWYTSEQIAGPYHPVDPDDYVVTGSEKSGLYGTNFLQISEEPEEFIAYGWYHRLHTLETSRVFQVSWDVTEPAKRSLSIVLSSI
ncbi:MAG: family 43 glycosylhydrolase [Myxacorys californica WJT36-NPBG1]|jgi:beta-fructofuranosidase|nr:family 43 glycosylhydrolase [Myxacorys californica WJT36-NPBG1]